MAGRVRAGARARRGGGTAGDASGAPGSGLSRGWRVVLVDDRSARRHGLRSREATAPTGSSSSKADRFRTAGWARSGRSSRDWRATGDVEYLLLTDADILHAPSSLRDLVAESEARGLGARQPDGAAARRRRSIERLLVPPFAFFFALLYPMRWATTPAAGSLRRPAAACSFAASALEAIGGFAAIRGEVIDDVNLAAAVKRAGPADPAGGQPRSTFAACAPIERWAPSGARSAGRRSRSSGTRGSCSAATTVALVRSVRGAARARRARPERCRRRLPARYWARRPGLAATLVYLPTVRFYRLFPLWALTLPLAGLLYGAMTVDSAIRHARGERAVW